MESRKDDKPPAEATAGQDFSGLLKPLSRNSHHCKVLSSKGKHSNKRNSANIWLLRGFFPKDLISYLPRKRILLLLSLLPVECFQLQGGKKQSWKMVIFFSSNISVECSGMFAYWSSVYLLAFWWNYRNTRFLVRRHGFGRRPVLPKFPEWPWASHVISVLQCSSLYKWKYYTEKVSNYFKMLASFFEKSPKPCLQCTVWPRVSCLPSLGPQVLCGECENAGPILWPNPV